MTGSAVVLNIIIHVQDNDTTLCARVAQIYTLLSVLKVYFGAGWTFRWLQCAAALITPATSTRQTQRGYAIQRHTVGSCEVSVKKWPEHLRGGIKHGGGISWNTGSKFDFNSGKRFKWNVDASYKVNGGVILCLDSNKKQKKNKD